MEVASALLRALAEAPGPSRLSYLARATEMPTAKAHRYLVGSARGGLVEQDPGEQPLRSWAARLARWHRRTPDPTR